MTAETESQIKELKAYLDEQFNQVYKRLDRIDAELKEVRMNQAKIEGTMEAWKPSIQKIPDLAERVGELKNYRQIA